MRNRFLLIYPSSIVNSHLISSVANGWFETHWHLLTLLIATVITIAIADAKAGFFNPSFSKPSEAFITAGASASGSTELVFGETLINFSSIAGAEATVSLIDGSSVASASGRWPNTTSLTWGFAVLVTGPGWIIFDGTGVGNSSSDGLSGVPPFNTYAVQGNGGTVRFGRNGPSMLTLGQFFNDTLHLEIEVPLGTFILSVSDETRADVRATAGVGYPNAFAAAQSSTTWTARFVIPELSTLLLTSLGATLISLYIATKSLGRIDSLFLN